MPATHTLRPATDEDFDFAHGLYRELMEALTIAILGVWRDDGQRAVVRAGIAAGLVRIVEVDGRPVGWLQVREHADHLALQQIYVATRGRGIGTALIRELQARGLPIALSVLKNNPRARALYERLGFTIVGETEHKLEMWWVSSAGPGDRPT